jgi:hypothetical protein
LSRKTAPRAKIYFEVGFSRYEIRLLKKTMQRQILSMPQAKGEVLRYVRATRMPRGGAALFGWCQLPSAVSMQLQADAEVCQTLE